MKRNLLIVFVPAILLLLSAPVSFAQEEVKETVKKRIKVVKVDEEGNKVVIDTTLSSDFDLDEFDLGKSISIFSDDTAKWTVKEGNVFIMKKGDGHKSRFYTNDKDKVIDKEGVFVIKSGDGDTFSIVEIDSDDKDPVKNILIEIDEDVIHSKGDHIIMKAGKHSGHTYIVKSGKDGDSRLEWISEDKGLEEGQTHIVIRSNNEVEEMIIEGDAVITIKDGKVKMEGDTIKKAQKKDKVKKN